MPPIFDSDMLAEHVPEDRSAGPFPVVRDSRPSNAYTTLARRPVGGRIEVDDRAYHRGSAVTLPFQHSEAMLVVPGDALVWRDETFAKQFGKWNEDFSSPPVPQLVEPANDRLTLSLVATACLLFRDDRNAGLRLLVAGHGTEDEHADLTAARARNLGALLGGDRQSFAASCLAFNVAEDLETIAHFLGRFFGWSFGGFADPRAAFADFRRGYNARLGKPAFEGWFAAALPDSDEITAEDWGGIYDCYSMVIAAMAGVATAGELAAARARVQFAGEGHSGYGSTAPRPKALSRSLTDRRAEILGFRGDVATRIGSDPESTYVICDLTTFDPQWLIAAPKSLYELEPTVRELAGTEPLVLEATLSARPEGLEYVRWLYDHRPAYRGNVDREVEALA